ncbi:hypothetical protein HDV06_002025 [Boothiomyces sp. JEL0866]|nr:hypothetical protein HDV06_002025 [Boothiomyces sp. JEL0866]
MCHIKNLQTPTTSTLNVNANDFDAWFESLKTDLKMSPELDTLTPPLPFEDSYQQLFPQLPLAFEPSAPVPASIPTVAPVDYPSPTSTNSLKREHSEVEVDEALMKKRQRQNDAAKRCRQKKLNQLQECQEKAKRFENEMFEMSVRLAVLEKERTAWLVREKELQERVQLLKCQLDESHLILMRMKHN